MDSGSAPVGVWALGITRRALADVLERSVEDVAPTASLKTDLGLDSVSMVETLVVIEESYGIAMPSPDHLLERAVSTVADLAGEVAASRLAMGAGGLESGAPLVPRTGS